MDNHTTVDVVIPSLGRESLKRAVDSVLHQTVNTRAIVVLDDPSRRLEIESMLRTAGQSVLVLETTGRVGGARARNIGLENTTSDAVAFLDDDDWWEKDSLERRLALVQNLDKNQAFFVSGAFWHGRRQGNSKVVPWTEPPKVGLDALASYITVRDKLRFGRTAIQTSTLLLSGDLAREIGWDNSLKKHQDWDFALRATADPAVHTAWLSEPTVHVEKDSPASISRRLSWQDSLHFLNLHPEIQKKSRADFLAVHVLRSAIAERSFAGLREYRKAKPGLPHLAALVLAGSSIIRR